MQHYLLISLDSASPNYKLLTGNMLNMVRSVKGLSHAAMQLLQE